MKSTLSLLATLSIFAAVVSGARTLQTETAKEKPTKRSNSKSADNGGAGLPTKLPEFRAKKRVTVDFAGPEDSTVTTVIVSNPAQLNDVVSPPKTPMTTERTAVGASIDPTPRPRYLEPIAIDLTPAKPSAATTTNAASAKATPDLFPSDQTILRTGRGDMGASVSAATTSADSPAVVATGSATKTAETQVPQAKTDSATATAVPAATNAAPMATAKPAAKSGDEIRFQARFAYLAAKYSYYKSDLQDGATAIALGASRTRGDLEGRALLEVGHGLDQAMTPQNTRYALLRADVAYFAMRPYAPSSSAQPYVSGGLGIGTFDLRSYRQASGSSDLVIREHIKGTALIITPALGVRFDLGAASLDLSAEYLALVGSGTVSHLGGWTGALGVGVPF